LHVLSSSLCISNLAFALRILATPITYTEEILGAGQLGSVTFDGCWNRILILTFHGDD